MKVKQALFCILFLLGSLRFFAQVEDSSIFVPLMQFSYSFQIPGADLSDRFGSNSDIALDFMIKTRSNWRFGGRVSYIFGDKVRENGILDSIATSSGAIINSNGQFASIRLFERGMTWMFTGGRLFPALGPNPNCGFYLDLSIGGIFHKIRIEDVGNLSYQLTDEYKKGYDRLTSGTLVGESFGYQYIGSRKMINFFLCVESYQGFTTSRRSFNYDTMTADTSSRLDLLFGLRAGWVLPLYKRTAREIYYH
ncbi:MAG: hypothetical protein IT233_01190 [Bacteroidia bacterium]|nr:hypothetical protein [Bacteroidia bacterium]